MWRHSSSEHFIYPNKNIKNAVYFFFGMYFWTFVKQINLTQFKTKQTINATLIGVDLDFLPPGKIGGVLISITGSITDKNCSELSHPEMSITQINSVQL